MKTTYLLSLVALGIALVSAGCKQNGSDSAKPSSTSSDKEYDIKVKVISIGEDKKSVKLDHEDIPGFMKAMKMEFTVESPQVLQGIAPGDKVQGRLKVKPGGDYLITQLKKT